VKPTKEDSTMNVDPRALTELLEESQDLQADAMRPTHETLDELVELHLSSNDDDLHDNKRFHEDHQRGLTSSLSGATLLSAARRRARLGGFGLNVTRRPDPADGGIH
jgi:hypothetical protein